MTDLLLSPWPYGYALIVLGLVLSYVWLCAAAAVHGLNDHFDWHARQQEHEAEKHGKHLAQRRLKAREKRESIDSRHGEPNLGEVGGEDETVADVIEKALQEGE